MNNVQPEKFIRAAIFSASGKTSAGTRSKGCLRSLFLRLVRMESESGLEGLGGARGGGDLYKHNLTGRGGYLDGLG